MVVLKWLISTALVASAASATIWDAMIPSVTLKRNELSLLKRQNLSAGSPLYNCHDNCGEAILEISACVSVCNDTTFLTDYNNCLLCSGPDNQNIWQYYGGELNTTAAACGLPITPLSGAQDDVDAAVAASNTTAACTAATESNSTATATGSSASSTSSSSSAAGPTSMANFAGYGAVAVAALYAIGL